MREVLAERTLFAVRDASTVQFADVDDERVKFVVMAGQLGGVFGWATGRRGEGLIGEGLDFGVLCFFGNERVTRNDAAQVFIDDHRGRVEGIQEDGVGCFGTDAGERQQFFANLVRGTAGGFLEVLDGSAVFLIKKGDEGLQRCRLAQHETGGPDEIAEFLFGNRAEGGDGKDIASFEAGNRAFHAFPGGVLGQVGADNDFESGFRGPPLLRTETLDEMVVHGAQATRGSAPICGSDCRPLRFRLSAIFRHTLFDLKISGVGRIV